MVHVLIQTTLEMEKKAAFISFYAQCFIFPRVWLWFSSLLILYLRQVPWNPTEGDLPGVRLYLNEIWKGDLDERFADLGRNCILITSK